MRVGTDTHGSLKVCAAAARRSRLAPAGNAFTAVWMSSYKTISARARYGLCQDKNKTCDRISLRTGRLHDRKGRKYTAVSTVATGLLPVPPFAVPDSIRSSVDTSNLVPRFHITVGAGLYALEAEEEDRLAICILEIRVDLHAGRGLVVGPAAGLDAGDVDLPGGHCEMASLSAKCGLLWGSEEVGLDPWGLV